MDEVGEGSGQGNGGQGENENSDEDIHGEGRGAGDGRGEETGGIGGAEKNQGRRNEGMGSEGDDNEDEDGEDEDRENEDREGDDEDSDEEDEDSWQGGGGNRDSVCTFASSSFAPAIVGGLQCRSVDTARQAFGADITRSLVSYSTTCSIALWW